MRHLNSYKLFENLNNPVSIEQYLNEIGFQDNFKPQVIKWWNQNRQGFNIHYFNFTSPKPIGGVFLGVDEIAINKDIEASQKTLKTSNEITTRYRRMIVEVDGNREFGYISNFVANRLLAGDSKALRKYAGQITPDLDLSFDYTSPVTGETEALRIPFGIGFFYPAD